MYCFMFSISLLDPIHTYFTRFVKCFDYFLNLQLANGNVCSSKDISWSITYEVHIEDRQVTHSRARSLAHSLARSFAHSITCSIARLLDHLFEAFQISTDYSL